MPFPHSSIFALGDQVHLGDAIVGTVEEVIYRRNCIHPLYCISYWLDGKQELITVPEQDVYTK